MPYLHRFELPLNDQLYNVIGIILTTKRCHLIIPSVEHAPLLLAYYQTNQAHLAQWEPLREACFYTLAYWQVQVQKSNQAFEAGTEYKFIVLNHRKDEVIGVCNFTNVCRGIFQACNLGYSIDKQYEGQGLMQDLLSSAL